MNGHLGQAGMTAKWFECTRSGIAVVDVTLATRVLIRHDLSKVDVGNFSPGQKYRILKTLCNLLNMLMIDPFSLTPKRFSSLVPKVTANYGRLHLNR